MKRPPRYFLSTLAAVIALVGGNLTGAATFTSVSQARSVDISGHIDLTDLDTGEVFSASLAPHAQTAPGDFGLFDQAVGLGALVLDNPLGAGNGAGRAAQTSSFAPDAIRFDGVADVFMSGQVFGNADISGSGSASSLLAYRFSVAQAVTVRLAMNSEIGPRLNQFDFALTRENGDVVWDQTEIVDIDGNPDRTFTQLLDLAPGVYDLGVVLSAASFFSTSDMGASGRVLADFSIVPVPEADTMVTTLGGLLLLGWVARRRVTR